MMKKNAQDKRGHEARAMMPEPPSPQEAGLMGPEQPHGNAAAQDQMREAQSQQVPHTREVSSLSYAAPGMSRERLHYALDYLAMRSPGTDYNDMVHTGPAVGVRRSYMYNDALIERNLRRFQRSHHLSSGVLDEETIRAMEMG